MNDERIREQFEDVWNGPPRDIMPNPFPNDENNTKFIAWLFFREGRALATTPDVVKLVEAAKVVIARHRENHPILAQSMDENLFEDVYTNLNAALAPFMSGREER